MDGLCDASNMIPRSTLLLHLIDGGRNGLRVVVGGALVGAGVVVILIGVMDARSRSVSRIKSKVYFSKYTNKRETYIFCDVMVIS